MTCEIYSLNYNGKLRFDGCDDAALVRDLERWDGKGVFPGFNPCRTLGDENLLYCVVHRSATGPGGLFVVHDGDGPLLAAVAHSNLTFVQGMAYFARATTYARYASDIFEHADDDDA